MKAIHRDRPAASPPHQTRGRHRAASSSRRRVGLTILLTSMLTLLLATTLVDSAPAYENQIPGSSGNFGLVGAGTLKLESQGTAQDLPAFLAVQQAQLTAADGSSNDYFGTVVAVSGDTALVGVPYEDDYSGTGAAYVFVRSGAGWTQQAKLTASDAADFDWFGSSVALSGDTALVCALRDDVDGNYDQGSAYVFVRSGASWTQQAHLIAAGNGYLGSSAALSGNTALVGGGGFAYVFTRSGASWSQQAKLAASDGTAMGSSAALSGDTALLGAPGWNTSSDVNSAQGTAYVFVRSGDSWSQQAQLTAADGAHGDYFGYSVALSGDTALVGPEMDSVPYGPHQGSAYVFVRSGTNWSQQAQLTASDGGPYAQFGYSVAVSGDTALVGAPWDGGLGTPANSHGAADVLPAQAQPGVSGPRWRPRPPTPGSAPQSDSPARRRLWERPTTMSAAPGPTSTRARLLSSRSTPRRR